MPIGINHPFSYILTTCFKPRLIKQLLGKDKKRDLLDIGCGSGFLLSKLGGQFDQVFGIDVSPEALALAKKFTNAKLTTASAEELPFARARFDCIVSTDAFEHIPNDAAAIHEVKRVLRPDGIFVIYVPSEQGIFSNTKLAHAFHTSQKSYLLDYRYYTIVSLKALLEKSGLSVEYVGYHNVFFQEFFTQILKWIALLMNKKYEHQADIITFLDSSFFPIYRWILLPAISYLVRMEEFVCEKVFRARLPGHRIVAKCRNIEKA